MDSEDDDMDPTRIFQPNNSEDDDSDYSQPEIESATSTSHQHQDQDQQTTNPNHHHHIRSIDSTVVIRQLPSQGLSFQLWPAATTLVNLLDNHRMNPNAAATSAVFSDLRRPIRILELGSGTGLVGISAAVTLSATVTVTDLPTVIENLRFNAEANAELVRVHGGSVRVAALRWGEIEDMERIGKEYDIVLGSDVVYHSHLYEILLRTLKFLLGGEEKCVFVMAHLRRWKKDSVFFKKARKLFHVQVIASDDPVQGCRVGVVVYTFVAKRFAISNAVL